MADHFSYWARLKSAEEIHAEPKISLETASRSKQRSMVKTMHRLPADYGNSQMLTLPTTRCEKLKVRHDVHSESFSRPYLNPIQIAYFPSTYSEAFLSTSVATMKLFR